jgi:hypothetical protein
MIDEYRLVGGMRIGRGNRSIRRKPGPSELWHSNNGTYFVVSEQDCTFKEFSLLIYNAV